MPDLAGDSGWASISISILYDWSQKMTDSRKLEMTGTLSLKGPWMLGATLSVRLADSCQDHAYLSGNLRQARAPALPCTRARLSPHSATKWCRAPHHSQRPFLIGPTAPSLSQYSGQSSLPPPRKTVHLCILPSMAVTPERALMLPPIVRHSGEPPQT
jgi:hypothetical protein